MPGPTVDVVSGMHFERMASEYAGARPPYPAAVYDVLEREGVVGDGLRVLEVGAGAGLATGELVRSGSEVVAVEPGAELATLLRRAVPAVDVVPTNLEDAQLPANHFDSVVSATAMHWVDLSVGLPKVHTALRPHGSLAVWRTVFGDDSFETEFRDRVAQIVALRGRPAGPVRGHEPPTMEELAAGDWFAPVRTERWRWSIDLSSEQVRNLFATFSDWTPLEVAAAARAADDLGGRVTEHYQTVLHLLRGR